VSLLLWAVLLLLPSANVRGAPQEPAGAASGEQSCQMCHEAIGTQFQRSVHARLVSAELRGKEAGCEACHGAGARHAESGDAGLIFGFKKSEAREVNRVCQTCHGDNTGHDWAGSQHALNGLACTDCHRIHQSRRVFATTEKAFLGMRPRFENAPPPKNSLAKPELQLCLECHKEKTAQMMFSSHHPLREGKMQCSSCHQVHGSPVKQLRAEERVNDLCLKCHTAKQGPFVFEHAPAAENCLTCHEPHGTVANNLLRQNEPFLCLQCHEAHFHVGRSGITTPLSLPSGTASNKYGERGWRVAFTTKCTQCHSMIHGTDLPGQSVTSRGKALTR
jgi:predicted CXXCH cytochrome family protein